MKRIVKRTQLQRIGALVHVLQSRQVTKNEIIERLFDKFDKKFCQSQIEKDMYILKNDFDAPINTVKKDNFCFYYLPSDYDFREALYQYVCL